MKKRIIALVLVLVMVFGALPMTAGAAESYLWPVPSSRTISPDYPGHNGMDISAASGANIVASKSGTIKFWVNACQHEHKGMYGCTCSDSKGVQGMGNGVVIQHSDGKYTYYSHMQYNSIPSKFRVNGAKVNQGDIIGRIGSSGWSTGYHLDFMLTTGYWGTYIKPQTISFIYSITKPEFVISNGILTEYNGNGGAVTIPAGVKEIKGYVFSGNTKITSVVIPEGCNKIGEYAFWEAINLTKVTLPSTMKHIGGRAFGSCGKLSSINFPSGLTDIGTAAFFGCNLGRSIHLPASLTTFGDAVLDGGNKALTTITVDAANPNYSSDGYVLYNNDKSRLICYPPGNERYEFTVPSSVKVIAYSGFSGNNWLRHIEFPEGLTTFEYRAVSKLSNLTSLVIPSTVKSISNRAFEYSTSLGSVTIKTDSFSTDASDGIFWNSNPNLVIRARTGSSGQSYAQRFGHRFEILSDQGNPPIDPPPTPPEEPTTPGTPEDPITPTDPPPSDPTPPPTTTTPFTDVATHWGKDAIEWVHAQGLFSGTSDTKFSPNGQMNRAMLATVLWRLAGKSDVSGSSGFSDVPTGQYYSDAVKWAADNEIVTGIGNNKFNPSGSVTREQLAVMLHRYAKKQGNAGGSAGISSYPDAGNVSGYALEAMEWAVGNGIITGKSGKLDPKGNATRAEVATMMMRFAG